MKKNLVKLLAFFCFVSAEAERKVELNLKASVDPLLNLERLDNNGDINLFDRTESHYRIAANQQRNVKVTISTRNRWKAKRIGGNDVDERDSITYRAQFKGQDSAEDDLGADKEYTEIKQDRFNGNCYEFSLIFYPEKSVSKYNAGNYSDTITVNIAAN